MAYVECNLVVLKEKLYIACYTLQNENWVVTEKIHTPPTEEISAFRRGRGEKIISDNSKCIRTSKGGRGVNFLFPPLQRFPFPFGLPGWYGCFLGHSIMAFYIVKCIHLYPRNKP